MSKTEQANAKTEKAVQAPKRKLTIRVLDKVETTALFCKASG